MIKCCKNSVPPKRYIGCHDFCPKYLAEKRDYELRKKSLKEHYDILDDVRRHTKYK